MKPTERNNDRETLIRDAAALVVVDDGAYMWVGDRDEVYDWLEANGFARGHDRNRNTPNSTTLTARQYDRLCRDTECYVDTSGSYGPSGVDPHELIDEIIEAEADFLFIH